MVRNSPCLQGESSEWILRQRDSMSSSLRPLWDVSSIQLGVFLPEETNSSWDKCMDYPVDKRQCKNLVKEQFPY